MVALVVLNYNDYKTVNKFLSKAEKLQSIDKIVVVDNCSTDESYLELQQKENEKITLLRTSKNNGYASGNNYGIRYAIDILKAKIILVANPDVEIPDSTASALVDFVRNNSGTGIVSGKMECCGSVNLPIATKLPMYKDCILENFIILKKIIGSTLDYPVDYWIQDVAQVDVVPGSLFAISSDTYNCVGGLDENTFLYYEESILAFRLRRLGYKNYILTKYSYLHYHSISIDKNIKSNAKKLKIAHKSRMYYCRNYLNICKLQQFVLSFSFYMGTSNYMVANYLVKDVLKK